MRFSTISLLAVVLVQAPAFADSDHVATRPFIEHEVVGLTGRADFESTIAFGEGEHIENIAIGQSGAWQVTPNRRADLLFIKPVTATAAATNMTVVTDRHTYLFELHASARTNPLYFMRFTYPDPPPTASATSVPGPEASPQSDRILIPAVSPALPIDTLNFAWSMTGAKALFPERCFDDGHSVYLAWGASKALPAVLSIGPDGKTEGPVNYTAEGDYLIVAGFHRRLVLRSGKDMATLETRRLPPVTTARSE